MHDSESFCLGNKKPFCSKRYIGIKNFNQHYSRNITGKDVSKAQVSAVIFTQPKEGKIVKLSRNTWPNINLPTLGINGSKGMVAGTSAWNAPVIREFSYILMLLARA